MSYNKYNTRHSGRFNTPGQFVPAGELAGGAAPGGGAQRQQHNNPNLAVGQPFNQQSFTTVPQPPLPQQPRQVQQQNLQNVPIQQQNPDVEMKTEPGTEGNNEGGNGGGGGGRPHWMKNKLGGVKKISNKERRRRQNETLRRLLTPKNALMVLNEMMPNEQLATQFKVEAAGNQFYKPANQQSFCADLTLDGNVYKGYGENKLSARNAAAEKAIRDLIIKRMSKVFANDAANAADAENADSAEGDNANGENEETLPMIQLASFALHKLFSEWEYEGVKVPQLKSTGQQGNSTECMEVIAPPPPKPKPPMKRKELPPNAAALHPCMLLTYMRPGLEYRELAVSGDKPQTMLFTMGVDVDGATYIGKASNKKEARRAAARAACAALFNVSFPDAAAPPPGAAPPMQQ
ncbi:double-stranded RNA-specific editase 1 isoform X1 [Cydia pomonella]|uniref:double-stranded RNA-specific editase 1 isoform X1 n=1 Tax=Cydia pomonella TaxID=82600 RepID=UPI002ADE1EF5|nr:double-stranded RNA-specific editase 1 isoform X1 [Cydia pomonella]